MTFKEEHALITDCFYNNKPYKGKVLTQNEFSELHDINALKQEKDKLSKGKKISLSLNEIDSRLAILEK